DAVGANLRCNAPVGAVPPLFDEIADEPRAAQPPRLLARDVEHACDLARPRPLGRGFRRERRPRVADQHGLAAPPDRLEAHVVVDTAVTEIKPLAVLDLGVKVRAVLVLPERRIE